VDGNASNLCYRDVVFKPELRRVGKSQSPLVVIDNFSSVVDQIAALADELAPFPPIQDNYYPGVRRLITKADKKAYAYVAETCSRAAPFIGAAFQVPSFDLEQASFSVVTLQPDQLQPAQRMPHFDGPEPNLFAALHYLRVPEASGTAFYRHRATGIERVTPANIQPLQAARSAEPVDAGYINSSTEYYEQIEAVEAVPDRLIIYHGSLLHSGIIPERMAFTANPREGRLTANFFLLGR
jgi:Family of unknown function (DUF6445)